ncbi:MAG: hypothetical protein WCR21_13720 [Bacteroidota bacterium]
MMGCKRGTNIKVKAVIAALDEPCRDCKVVLVERKENGLFSSNAQCNAFASATTDNNGECSFDKERLKTRNSYDYFLTVSNAYGQQLSSTCSGKTSGFIKLGESQEQTIDASGLNGTLVVQYNNLLNPSQMGDSLIVSISTISYLNPKDGSIVQGGGGVFGGFPFYNPNNPPNYPPTIVLDPKQTKAQRLQRYVRRRKMGVMSVKVDTVKIYPNQTTTVVIDW